VRILSLGQCLIYGYDGVDHASTFVNHAVAKLATRFADHDITLVRKHLYHPNGLKAILRHRFLFSQPDIVVISVIASFAVQRVRVNLLYEMAPEIVDTARSFMRKIEARATGHNGAPKQQTAIDRFAAWHPPIALAEYERLVEEGVDICQSGGARVVLLGPGRFNEDIEADFSVPRSEVPILFASVNEMVRRVSKRKGAQVVDAQGALCERGGEVFLPQNIRWSRLGHDLVARELENVLASEIIRSNPSAIGRHDDRIEKRQLANNLAGKRG
jgi:hypothetical protein